MLPLDESNAIVEANEELLQNIIATVLELIVVSWSSIVARNQLCTSASEVDIAGYLVKEMVAEKFRRFGRYSQFRIEEEVGTRSSTDIRKPDGRIDIKIVYSFVETEYFGIECKRINDKGNDLAKKYVSKGLMRFVTGKYSPGHDWMAMIGFVVDGKPSQCIERIRGFLAITRKRTHMKGEWMQKTEFGNYQHLYGTCHHQRGKHSPITVLHLFLTLPANSHAEASANQAEIKIENVPNS